MTTFHFRLGLLPFFLLACAASPGLAQSGNTLKLSGSEPIAIEGDSFEVREADGIAIFTGAVNVTQGQSTMKAGRLVVHYDKQGEGSVMTGSAAITKLEMSGKVVLRSPTQSATADEGVFDMASEVLVLSGSKVVLTEGDNVAVGCKLTYQMKSGKADLQGCKGTGSGRVQIMINPKSQQGN
ncbi:MAG: LPS ABC transporter substrate-binding protein LptA [Rhizobiaceae bacterium]|jgi:lipopolysaccharide export system protein LptA|nr:LPS ABC transporter substrate-binding protein LptA [Rhizobiaceae bacterium]